MNIKLNDRQPIKGVRTGRAFKAENQNGKKHRNPGGNTD